MRDLNRIEFLWLHKLLDVEFKGCEILKEQVSKTKVTVVEDYAFVSVKFFLEGSPGEFPYNVRVPVEMRAYQENSAPIVFLLHIIDGFVNELEVITADSSQIATNAVSLDNLEYDINDELKL